MYSIFWKLILNIALGIALGYRLSPYWFKYTELVGIVALIGHSVLFVQKHEYKNELTMKLETNLFLIGCGLVLPSITAPNSNTLQIIIRAC